MEVAVVALFFTVAFSYTIIYVRATVGVPQALRAVVQKSMDRAVVRDFLRKGMPITETHIPGRGKVFKFGSSDQIVLKQAFNHLHFYPVVYEKEQNPTQFEIPIGQKIATFKLTNRPHGPFSLKVIREGNGVEHDLSNLQETVEFLSDPTLPLPLRKTLIRAFLTALEAPLSKQPDFKKVLQELDPSGTVTSQEREKVFRAGIELFSAIAIKRPTLEGLNLPDWLQETNQDIVSTMQEVTIQQSKEIAAQKETKLKYELTQSMLKTSEEAVKEWTTLKDLNVIEEKVMGTDKNPYLTVTIHETDQVSLREMFKLLQFYPELYKSQEARQTRFEIQIGGEKRKFRLSISPHKNVVNQIYVQTNDADWHGTTKRGKRGKGGLWGPTYDTMVDEVLSKFYDQKKLAKAILNAYDSKLNSQPNFSEDLKIPGKTVESADTIRATIEFMIISLVAEAAQPTVEFKVAFLTELAKTIKSQKEFPEKNMPKIAEYRAGRSPGMDAAVIRYLKMVGAYNRIEDVFSEQNFPVRKKGGTQEGRKMMDKLVGERVASYLIRQRSAEEHDLSLLDNKVEEECTRRRRKRNACSLKNRNSATIDETSIKIIEDRVEFDVVDRRDANQRQHVQLQISPEELATPKLIKDNLSNSRRAGMSETYAKINRGLAVHGLIFSVLAAGRYFEEGENFRGAMTVAQSAHTLGGITGLNEIASKVGQRVLSSAAKGLAKGLNLEKGLERLSTKVERFAERGVGQLLGAVPGVGLAFDIYFIEQDIEELANLDLNNPEDLKLLPLRVIDLALDVSTTVLNLVGTFCPLAEVVTEPLVIVLSIIRMAIDDFYIDIMAEIEKINWRSPWAGLEFLGALVKGFQDGAADFLTGGLRRQMESYRKQEQNDKKLIQDLKNPDNYYKIVGEKEGGGDTIDFTQGKLSSFGGYINFRLHDNNRATIEIGDVSGSHETIRKTFTVDPNLKDIVLGIGEARTFEYKHETAKLWFVIPVKTYNVICGESLHGKSLYGTYYGNSKDNTFYAVQKPKPTTKPPGKKEGEEECNFGSLNLKFVTGNYHYNLYGRGGKDTFYLGPEMSSVTGGSGSDLFIIQSDGGRTVIDNFAEDNMRDIIVINVNFDNIRCNQSGVDLDVTYSKSHHIRIKNWFIPGDPTYYRHVSFRSQDGVIFVPKQTLNSGPIHTVQCVAVALDLGAAKTAQTVSLHDIKYRQVKQVSGSEYSDIIVGNDVNNILDGSRGADHLSGGKDEDTYIIRANEGPDVIDNNADDYSNTTDVVVFDVPFEMIEVKTKGTNLSVSDRNNAETSCFSITKWTLGERYRHILFTSKDHVVFKVSTSADGTVSKVPMMLDYKTSEVGICVDLSDSARSPKCTKPTGYINVATVSDSPHNDHIVGNAQTNFLSCTGGEDYLEGGEGTDNYVVKKTCQKATINNFDSRQKVDLVYLEETFVNLAVQKVSKDLKVTSKHVTPTLVLRDWFNSADYQHLGIRTIDGITLRINSSTTVKLEPYEVSKDPTECQCTQESCAKGVITYSLDVDPWLSVVRLELKSSHCSYKIYGDQLNNYLDPGSGNGYYYQHLQGRNGSDTYVLNHGYGEFNEINNYADDDKVDTLQLGMEFEDINVYFHGQNDAILSSKTRPSSLSVRILDYFRGAKYQHLQIISADKVIFKISKQYPYKKVMAVDRRMVDAPQKIDPQMNAIIAEADNLLGSLTSPNNLTGSNTTRQIEGGAQADALSGGEKGTIFEGRQGNDTIYGGAGNDIIFGGDGDDIIYGDTGDDYIYAGDGSDIIDGGEGIDTLAFKGDGFLRKGVTVDLYIGFGKGVDAEGDIYKSVENVYGTIHNDLLTGSDLDNKLYGLEGDDSLTPHGGVDELVGGEGKDLYLLYKASGLKIIDNYADDEVEDTLSLVHLNSTDVCIFLIGDDLHLQIDKSNLGSVIFDDDPLAVIIRNWYVNAKYRHLTVLFSNTLWEDFALSAIAEELEMLGSGTSFIEEKTDLHVVSGNATDVSLSWKPTDHVLVYSETKLFVVHFKQLAPETLKETQVDHQTSFSVSSLDPASHYVFALALTKCDATVAVSQTLITYGRERPCHSVKVPHSVVKYTPSTSASYPPHGTVASVKCDVGYNIYNTNSETNATCLDKEWIPSLPVCEKIKQCPVPTKPTNGSVSTNGHEEGSKAYFVCHKGFLLNGTKERTCVDGTWDGEFPNCQQLSCPKPPPSEYGSYIPCGYIKHTMTYGTMDSPLEGYCVKLECVNLYLPSHVFHGKTYRPRWESDWEIPQGGRVCSDGKWIGYVEDICEPTARLTSVVSQWNKKSGLLQLWHSDSWKNASSTPSQDILHLSCKSAGIDNPQQVTHSSTSFQVRVDCSRLRLTQPKPTIYEGKVEQLTDDGTWEGICVTEIGTTASQFASTEICESLGFNYKSAVVGISTGWTDHTLVCSS